MGSHYAQKYLFRVFLAFMCIYFYNAKVDASIVNDDLYAVANQQRGDIDLNDPYFAKNFKCPRWNGVFPDVEDCSRYYMCIAGFPRRMRCPFFFNFDKYTRQCLSKWIATCATDEDDKGTTRQEEITTPVREKIFVCWNMFGTYTHPTDCSKYYKCSFFIPRLRVCPGGTLYHEGWKECRPENEVDCESRNKETTESGTITSPIDKEPTTPEVLEQTTPETIEETTTEAPTGPPETDCEEDDLDCIITETGKIPLWFKCPAELDSYSHPSSQRLFIFCINFKPKVKKCGQDLIYSQKLKTCTSPQ